MNEIKKTKTYEGYILKKKVGHRFAKIELKKK